jgi:RNA polymerase sigma factor (sigma-70 family)
MVRRYVSTFEEFYNESKLQCLRAVAAHTGRLDLAEDLVAESFVRALGNWRKVEQHPSPSAWVVTTAINLQRDNWRKEDTMRRYASRLNSTVQGSRAPGTPADPLATELLEAMSRLPERQRDTLIYRIILDLDTATTAHLLNLEPGTVTTHLRRALAAMRAHLLPALPEPSQPGHTHSFSESLPETSRSNHATRY